MTTDEARRTAQDDTYAEAAAGSATTYTYTCDAAGCVKTFTVTAGELSIAGGDLRCDTHAGWPR